MARYLWAAAAAVIGIGGLAGCGGSSTTTATAARTTTNYALDAETASRLADFEKRGAAFKPSMMDWFAANMCDGTTPAQCRCVMDSIGADGNARGFMLAVEDLIRRGDVGRHELDQLATTCA